ncbi:helix-turn-helix domain-containing protein [Lactococcus insecticola]|uniref:HTH cro/C1-type domain-containing protein n=1 Tax=Pseudolactococcus insecticola TaxID=2709158 RepID=A0A6A0BAH8_9LACT|nr:helix-turn-helix transcriptional regulator [Lactococcus insecticola]GFH40837.1 hypothetical protein Hs20B_12350 [Lactococcus insecticola]
MLPERLKTLRLEAKLTQKEISEKLEISVPAYLYWEKGTRVPSLERLQELAKILNVSTDYLLGNTNQKNMNSELDQLKNDILASATLIGKQLWSRLDVWVDNDLIPREKYSIIAGDFETLISEIQSELTALVE